MSVGRICVREVDVVSLDESVRAAASRMHDRKVGTLVVVSSESVPIGMVTDRDLVTRVLAHGLSADEIQVADVMTEVPRTVHEEASIEDALAIMRAGSFRRVPVVDSNRHLVGLLSLDDILSLLAEEFRDIGLLIEGESPSSLSTAK